MDWLEEEMGEHEYLVRLMEMLELGFYDAIDVGSDEEMPDAAVECVDVEEVLEHTILVKLM